MDTGLSSIDNRRLIIYALPLVALLCIAGLAITSDAALIDPEPPAQYETHADAYVLKEIELGTQLTIRKEGGGDRDYIRIPFLNTNDVVTVSINQSQTNNQVEYWVEDANKFPIYFYQYNGLPANPIFDFSFAAVVSGPYYVYHGQGFGTSYINMTIDRVNISPPPVDKDSNNMPLAKVTLTDGQTVRQNAGLPWDPSDFYVINIQPDANTNKYLSIGIASVVDTRVQWEIYDSVSINRPSLDHTSDTWLMGDASLDQRRITVPGDYIFRIWMKEGYGQYNLTVTILSYPNDQDNSVDEATTILDNALETGDVNLSFDREDYYEIYLEEGQPLWATLTPVSGPADLYLFDEFMNQKDASRQSDMAIDHIDGWKPDTDGIYYIVVEAVYEAPNWEDPPTVDYTLKVWINYAPKEVRPYNQSLKNYHLDEDTLDTDYDVTVVFEDADGDVLTYELDMSYNNTLIDIQLQEDNTLRIEPVDDASDFKVQILLNATDPHGLRVNYTAFIWVDPVNDGPYVDEDEGPFIITMGEDLVKSGVNVTKAFRDMDDDFGTWTFSTTSTEHINVGLDEDTWLATFTPLWQDWSGVETFVVTCTDKEGKTATITFTINMGEINDPPIVKKYIQKQTILEEESLTIDLEDYEGGPVFEDIEGKALTYKYDNHGDILISVSGSNITFTGSIDFVGLVTDLKIWAEDDLGARSVNMTLAIDVLPTNDRPKLDVIKESATVQENEGVTFLEGVYYEFEDDSPPLSVTWNWYVDGEQVPPEQVFDKYAFEYVPPVTNEKDRTVIVKLEVIDGEFTVPIEWNITVTNLNVKPDEPTFTHDTNKTEFKEGEKITFSATGTDLDGDDLIYKWYLDVLEEVGTGKTLELKDVKPGLHKVTVEITDPSGASSTADFDFTVKKKADDNGSPGFGGAYVALALIGVVAILAFSRRRQ